MDKLILNPTDISQWHALINEAVAKREVSLPEELESYLVFLLMRFSQEPQVSSSVIAIEFLTSHQFQGQQRADSLRKVGDKCLLLSGLFPGNAAKRQVSVSYFVEIGRSAYQTLSDIEEQTRRALYKMLSKDFVMMMDVLQATRQLSNLPMLLPIQAEEMYADLGNDSALESLSSYIQEHSIYVKQSVTKKKH